MGRSRDNPEAEGAEYILQQTPRYDFAQCNFLPSVLLAAGGFLTGPTGNIPYELQMQAYTLRSSWLGISKFLRSSTYHSTPWSTSTT